MTSSQRSWRRGTPGTPEQARDSSEGVFRHCSVLKCVKHSADGDDGDAAAAAATAATAAAAAGPLLLLSMLIMADIVTTMRMRMTMISGGTDFNVRMS